MQIRILYIFIQVGSYVMLSLEKDIVLRSAHPCKFMYIFNQVFHIICFFVYSIILVLSRIYLCISRRRFGDNIHTTHSFLRIISILACVNNVLYGNFEWGFYLTPICLLRDAFTIQLIWPVCKYIMQVHIEARYLLPIPISGFSMLRYITK